MSAALYWIPISTQKQHLDVWTPSAFVTAMERAFGPQPWKLGQGDVTLLRGMAAVYGSHNTQTERRNPFEVLIVAIDNEGESRDIEVWPEY